MLKPDSHRPYRFGFVLTTAAGNMTRYLNLRKYAERDPEVECVWAPIKHFVENRLYARLPLAIRMRAYVLQEARSVMGDLGRFDAVMFHAFEPFALAAMRSRLHPKPILVWSQDNPPISEAKKRLPYGGTHSRSAWRWRLRFAFDRWCVRKVKLFLPWSHWAGDALIDDCGVPAERVQVINVGLDLECWPFVPRIDRPAESRMRILFVGGSFVRNGGDLLLDVFCRHFAETAELHLVTKEPPQSLPPNVYAYTDLEANDPRLRDLYALADLFVLPTRADTFSLASLEAMATGRAVIVSPVGGIPDIVCDGETGFLVAPDDEVALTNRIEILRKSPERRRVMGLAGRARVEKQFDAAVCVPRILEAMKSVVEDERR